MLRLWHVRHGIRSDDSLDAGLVQALAAELDAEFILEEVDVPDERIPGKESLESTGRRLRYALLSELLERLDRSIALTAHHADDNAETILFNLVRGTGPDGLRGIAPALEDNIFRPFLGLNRSQLASYAEERGLKWIEDPSNQDTSFSRNLIRSRVMPVLSRINPEAVAHINRLPQIISQPAGTSEDGQFLYVNGSGLADQLPLLSRPDRDFAFIQYTGSRTAEPDFSSLAAALKESGCSPEWKLLHSLMDILHGRQNSAELGQCHFSLAADSILLCSRYNVQEDSLSWPAAKAGSVRLKLGEDEREQLIEMHASPPLPRWPELLSLHLRGNPVSTSRWFSLLPETGSVEYRFRQWQDGDRIKLPDGSTRKLGDIFTDWKIPSFLRKSWAVLADGEGAVAWLPGIADSKMMHSLDPQDVYRLYSIRRIQ